MNKLRYKRDYKRKGPFDIFYFRLFFEEGISDATSAIYEMESMNILLKNIINSTDTKHLKAQCTYRKCYDDTEYSISEMWVVDYGDGEVPDILCRQCMKDFEYSTDENKTLAYIIDKQKDPYTRW